MSVTGTGWQRQKKAKREAATLGSEGCTSQRCGENEVSQAELEMTSLSSWEERDRMARGSGILPRYLSVRMVVLSPWPSAEPSGLPSQNNVFNQLNKTHGIREKMN